LRISVGLARSKSGFNVDDISPAISAAIKADKSKSGFFQAIKKSKTKENGLLPNVVRVSHRISGKALPL